MNYTRKKMVGMTGFEPATSCSQSRRATKLRHIPDTTFKKYSRQHHKGSGDNKVSQDKALLPTLRRAFMLLFVGEKKAHLFFSFLYGFETVSHAMHRVNKGVIAVFVKNRAQALCDFKTVHALKHYI